MDSNCTTGIMKTTQKMQSKEISKRISSRSTEETSIRNWELRKGREVTTRPQKKMMMMSQEDITILTKRNSTSEIHLTVTAVASITWKEKISPI
jgi:hypothetical protein